MINDITFKRLSYQKIEVKYNLPIYYYFNDSKYFLTHEKVKFVLRHNDYDGYNISNTKGNENNFNRISQELSIKKKHFHKIITNTYIHNNEETCYISILGSITIYAINNNNIEIYNKIKDWKVRKRQEKIKQILND